MIFSLEELEQYALRGTLESHILSHGLLPMDVLKYVLEASASRREKLENVIDVLQGIADEPL